MTRDDVTTMLRDAAPDSVAPLDLDAAIRSGRRRQTAKRVGGAAAGVASLAVVAVVALAAPGGPGVEVDTPGFATGDADGTDGSTDSADAAESEFEQAQSEWDSLTLDEAIDRLAAVTSEAPELSLPPVGDQAVRMGRLYLAQESGWDGQKADPSVDTWQLTATERLINADGVGWLEIGTGQLTRSAGPVERDTTRELAQQLRPVPDRFRVGPDTPYGMTWSDDYDAGIAELVDWIETDRWIEVGAIADAMGDTSARLTLLAVLTEIDGLTYDGIVADLQGRPSVAFSLPYAPAGDARVDGVRSVLLLSPEDGQPHGWEYFDPTGDRVEWRSETITVLEIVDDFDPTSVQDLPVMPMPGDSPTERDPES